MSRRPGLLGAPVEQAGLAVRGLAVVGSAAEDVPRLVTLLERRGELAPDLLAALAMFGGERARRAVRRNLENRTPVRREAVSRWRAWWTRQP